MNVQPAEWLRIVPAAGKPLASVLSTAFPIPRDLPSGFRRLLNGLDLGQVSRR